MFLLRGSLEIIKVIGNERVFINVVSVNELFYRDIIELSSWIVTFRIFVYLDLVINL